MSLIQDREFQDACSRAEDAGRLFEFADQNLRDARMNLQLAEIAAERTRARLDEAMKHREALRRRFFEQYAV